MIDQEGVYDIPADVYHSDPVMGGSLSSTGARMLVPPSCPALFRHYIDNGRPDRHTFDHGHAAHSLVLGVGAPIASLPFDDRRTKAYKAAEQEAREAGRIPLLRKDADKVTAMAAALREHPVAGPLFARPGHAERTLVWRDDESGVWCRAMVDWMPDVDDGARALVVDYKSTVCAHPATFAKAAATYGYHQQGPFYCDGVSAVGLDNGRDPAFVLVAQEKEPPYLVTVGAPTPRALEWGRVLNRKARDVYRECSATGRWPGYSDEIEPLDIPGWLDAHYDATHDAGAYDTHADLIGDLS